MDSRSVQEIRRERYRRQKQAEQAAERTARQAAQARQATERAARQAAQAAQAAQREERERQVHEVDEFLDELAINVARLETGDLIENLGTVEMQIVSMFDQIMLYPDRMSTLRETITIMVQELNSIFEKYTKSPGYVREIGEVMGRIMELVGVEADVELMDTGADEDMAHALRQQLDETATRQLIERMRRQELQEWQDEE